ncbi:hypothetical protein BH11PLA1_BH11PLA1_14490 [soil metagenome]
MKTVALSVLAGTAILALALNAQAALSPGVYRLANHPDGTARPPSYGLRLDELYDVTAGNDEFTLDFDHALSSVWMTVTANTISISGMAWGGRDIGTEYANDQDRGVYSFSFTYNVGVGLAPGDDDLNVSSPSESNFGSITTARGQTFALSDNFMGVGTFRLGDEDNDLGHRGFAGTSGWGWLEIGNGPNGALQRRAGSADDFLFTVIIPSPGALALAGMGGMLASRRRR